MNEFSPHQVVVLFNAARVIVSLKKEYESIVWPIFQECLEQSLQIVQCIVSDSQPERPPDTKYSELKKSLALLNNQKSILTSFHSNPSE